MKVSLVGYDSIFSDPDSQRFGSFAVTAFKADNEQADKDKQPY